MARYRKRRYYKRRSGRWSPNIVKISSTNNASVGEFYNYENLAVNPIQTTTGVSQTFTVKNIEISFTLEGSVGGNTSYIESVTAYVMYVPQGMNITSSYYAEHPEYIMAYKYLGSPTIEYTPSQAVTPSSQQYQPYKIRTRMSRKLQTGDRLILYIQGSNDYTATTQYKIDGIVRWWSKAN